ncbi:YceK/YidQ family lipoprotein [bacterium]|nr:YceK/YidQ family lipoprotein [bacterium]
MTLASTGCGSLLATSLEPRPYAGTRGEVELLSRIGTRSVVADGVLLVDMPLTVAMDTVLLPITIPEAIAKH